MKGAEPIIEFPAGYLEKPLPSSDESERIILGAILLDNELISQAIEMLSVEDFYSPLNRVVFSAMVGLFNSQSSIDPVLVGEQIKKDNGYSTLESIGGIPAVVNYSIGIPFGINLQEYIKIVKDKSSLRKLIRACSQISSEAISEEVEASETIDMAEHIIYELSNGNTYNGFAPVIESITESVSLAIVRSEQNDVVTGLHTGLIDLDHKLQGLHNGELVVVAARPSVGKTALGVGISQNSSFRYGKKVAVFSLEMGAIELANRIVCSETSINGSRYKSGNLTEEEWMAVNSVRHRLADSKLFIDDSPYMTVPTMRAKLRRLCMSGKVDLVVVDYIQLMDAVNMARQGRQQEITQISRGLKVIAREFDCPVIAMSQLNREAEKRANHRPSLSDLRESGAIEQDADVVMFIYREDLYLPNQAEHSNIAELIIAKNRNGPTGVVNVRFDPNITKFQTLAKSF